MEEILIPNDSRHDVASFDIQIEGNAINPSYQVMSISVTKEINRIPFAKIILRDGEAPDRTFAISDADDLAPGRNIAIRVGRDGTNTQVFKGIITKHSIKVGENGNGELHIECRDAAMRMTIGRRSRYFENMKDSQLFDDLIVVPAKAGIQGNPRGRCPLDPAFGGRRVAGVKPIGGAPATPARGWRACRCRGTRAARRRRRS